MDMNWNLWSRFPLKLKLAFGVDKKSIFWACKCSLRIFLTSVCHSPPWADTISESITSLRALFQALCLSKFSVDFWTWIGSLLLNRDIGFLWYFYLCTFPFTWSDNNLLLGGRTCLNKCVIDRAVNSQHGITTWWM